MAWVARRRGQRSGVACRAGGATSGFALIRVPSEGNDEERLTTNGGSLMSAETSKSASLKQKAAHELQEFSGIFLYLACFFCAFATYSMLLLNQFHVSYFAFGTALINALVIAKVILIGEYAHLGKKHEAKPLFQSALYKAIMFSLLVFAFHVVEEMIKRRWHGETFGSAAHGIRISELLARSVVIFCTFLPLFAFRELERVMGEDKIRSLFFGTGATTKTDADC